MTIPFSITIRLLAAAVFCLQVPALRAQTITASPEDVAAVKSLVAAADAWDAHGKTRFEPDLATRLELSWRSVRDPLLRIKARDLIPDLERVAVLRPRLQEIAAATKAANGTVAFEAGGPQWLRDLLGADALHLLDRLTSVDLNDHQSPHDKTYKRNESLVDAWLDRLAGLPDLVSLDLANTSMQGPGLKVVGTLKTLERLNLTLTPITDAHLEHLSGLTHLRVISLASAKCSGEGFRFFGNLKQLESANFHFTPVDDAGLAGISNVPSLERLEIVHTHFTDAGTPPLAKLVNLERLQIGSREATGAAVKSITGLPKLRELDLHDNQATAEGVRHASQIASLRVLRVYGTIKDEGAEPIAHLANLEFLVVSSAGLTDAGLDHFSHLSKLKRLEIQNNKVTDAGVDRLKQALPGLEVIR